MRQRKVVYLFLYRNGIRERSVGVLRCGYAEEQPEITLELYDVEYQKKSWKMYYFNCQGGVTKAAFYPEWTAEHMRNEMRQERYHLCTEVGSGKGVLLLPKEKVAEKESGLPDTTEYLCACYGGEEIMPNDVVAAWKRKTGLPLEENACVQSAKRLMAEITKAASGEAEEVTAVSADNNEGMVSVRKRRRQKGVLYFEELLSEKASYMPWKGQSILHSVRISPEDFLYWPREYREWGENSFLLHGYYTYMHLLFGRRKKWEKEEYVLLVPGRYEKKEERLAASFGFYEFFPVISKEDKTTFDTGRFGYWCGKI